MRIFAGMKGEQMQAMIFAAGMGTRLKPLTDHLPKALVQVGGKPLLEHVLLRLRAAGISHVVINVHHFSSQIIHYLSSHDFQMDIRVSEESPLLLDTGGGLKKARPLLREDAPVLIHNVDILSNVDLRKFYRAGDCFSVGARHDIIMPGQKESSGQDKGCDHDHTRGIRTAEAACRQSRDPADVFLLASRRKSKRYLVFDGEMRLVGWTNIETGEVKSPYSWVKTSLPSLHLLAFAGIHLFSPRLFPLMDEWPDQFPIMDFYLKNCDKVLIRGYVQDNLQLMDVGKQETLAKAEGFLKDLKV